MQYIIKAEMVVLTLGSEGLAIISAFILKKLSTPSTFAHKKQEGLVWII